MADIYDELKQRALKLCKEQDILTERVRVRARVLSVMELPLPVLPSSWAGSGSAPVAGRGLPHFVVLPASRPWNRRPQLLKKRRE